jgi:hypothetical protein
VATRPSAIQKLVPKASAIDGMIVLPSPKPTTNARSRPAPHCSRERQIFERYTASLAALLADETGVAADDVEPWVAANALLGVHRALIYHVRRRMLAGTRNPRLAREVRSQGARALASLEQGLGGYAVKPKA